ncbi:MAG: hypothetical protein QNK05_13175 [Myxococcota bacterium]|nr:hypothetical protein [Myxococcota bacterium]
MDAAPTPSLASRPSHRQLRIRFASRASLISGLRMARREPAFDSCHVDLPTRELVVHMAGGFDATRPN